MLQRSSQCPILSVLCYCLYTDEYVCTRTLYKDSVSCTFVKADRQGSDHEPCSWLCLYHVCFFFTYGYVSFYSLSFSTI